MGLATALFTIFGVSVTVGGALMFAASIALQAYMSSKMRARQKAAAEARKGFELISEGVVSVVPLVYGRCKIGGARVFMDTSSNFVHADTGCDKQFNIGLAPRAASTKRVIVSPPTKWSDAVYETVYIPASDGGFLGKFLSGRKNEYLFVQQVLCLGPINAVHDLAIEERSIKDMSLASGTIDKPKAAFRADIYYDGGTACPLATANFSHRSTAEFPDVAYMTYAVRLDRDDPQFRGVPAVQSMIEGRKVRTIDSSNVLSVSRIYTANPAYCLLDYLLDDKVGAALDVSEIDLESFRAAALVCDTQVLAGASVGGPIWQPTDGARVITSRNIPLYELNMALDTSKPIRENIEAILTCMGDARLVWSRGQYKLLMQYPASNAAVVVAGELSDDDLVLEKDINVTWPSTSERLNHATIRYHDEANWFREASASWPPKEAGVFARGIGGRSYSIPGKNWEKNAGDAPDLLRKCAVWDTIRASAGMVWKVFIRAPGTYTFKYAVDDYVSGTFNGSAFTGSWNTLYTKTYTLSANSVVTIVANVADTGGEKGFAATLTSPSGTEVWNTRSPSYTEMQVINQTSTVYDTFMSEDNDVPLESDVFSDGITDYYHALAKAEELVRTSRSAFIIEFSYFLKDKFFEPGDFIRLNSEYLGMGSLLVRVSEVSVSDNLVVNIKGTRFDYTQLAWNVTDNVSGGAAPIWGTPLPTPENVTYSTAPITVSNSSGHLDWDDANDARVTAYRIYCNPEGELTGGGYLKFIQIGRTTTNSFDLPLLNYGAAIFGVRAETVTGSLSEMGMSDATLLSRGAVPPTPVSLSAVKEGNGLRLTWGKPTLRADGSVYVDHLATNIWRGTSSTFASATQLTQTTGTSYLDQARVFEPVYYWVQFLSTTTMVGSVSAAAGPYDFPVIVSDIDVLAAPPLAPLNLSATAGLTFISLTWDNPVYTHSGGHKATRLYGAEWVDDVTAPSIGDMDLIAEVTYPLFFFNTPIGTKWSFIAREVSQAGGLSTLYAGPVVAQTGKIGNTDLGPDIILAANIADGAVTVGKLGDGSVSTAKLANNAVEAGKIADGAVLVDKLAADAVTSDKIAANAIIAGKIASGAITTEKLDAEAVTAAKIVAGAVTSDKIAANAIVAGKIAAGAITAEKLDAGSVTANKLAAGAIVVGTAAIQAGAISSAMIGNAAIQSAHISNLSVETLKIAGEAVTQLGVVNGPTISVSSSTGDAEVAQMFFKMTSDGSGLTFILTFNAFTNSGTAYIYAKIVTIFGTIQTRRFYITTNNNSYTLVALKQGAYYYDMTIGYSAIIQHISGNAVTVDSPQLLTIGSQR